MALPLWNEGTPETAMGSEDSDSGEEDLAEKRDGVRLRWKDYLALSIAAVETLAMPLVVLMVVILLIALVASR
jgi:hypothetical protein